MRTLKDIPLSAQSHFDHWDMIGVLHKGKKDLNGNPINETWVDGGDSCHFKGIYHYCYFLSPAVRLRSEYYGNMMQRLHADVGNLRSRSFFGGLKRHPDEAHWYSDNNRMSRDQATPFLAALALMKARPLRGQLCDYAKRLFLFGTNSRRNGATAKNHGREYVPGKAYNYNWKLPDLFLFDIWAIFIRGFRAWYLYPILLIADLQTLINALLILRNKQDTDVANFFIKHSLSRKILPTPFSVLTQKLLPKLRLAGRIALRYGAPGMPTFVGYILREAIFQQEKEC